MPNINQGPINASRRSLENFHRGIQEIRTGRKFEPMSPESKRSPQGNQARANQRSFCGFLETKSAINQSPLSASRRNESITRSAMERFRTNLNNINNM